MFLKNLYLFRFSKPFNLTEEELSEKLKELPFVEPGPQEVSRQGFVAPDAMPDDMLVRSVDGRLQITLRTDTKKIPGSVIKGMMKERVDAIEQDQERKVRKKEKDEIKEEIMLELLPKTFAQPSTITGYFDFNQQLLIVGESSAKKAEYFASTLRKCLGSLPVRPIAFEANPAFTLTNMLQKTVPFSNNFGPGLKVVLKDPAESKSKVAIDNLDLYSDEVQNHLAAGMQVAKLDMIWDDKVFFSTDMISIKSIKFEDDLMAELEEVEGDAMSFYDAMFSLYTNTVSELITDFIELMGGEDRSAIVEE